MTDLVPPDSHHRNAAQGWLELGNPVEASAELDEIAPLYQVHPDVLELRWEIFARQKKWPQAAQVADRLVAVAAERCSGWIHRSFALHELKQTAEAFDKLLPGATKFPAVSTIPYNLACYSCQMDRLDEARRWLRVAMRVGDKKDIAEMARRDPDLKALWGEVS